MLKENLYTNTQISELIPITCHYDESTLLTRNGDLIQTIQINGFEADYNVLQTECLREMLRKAITKHIKSSNYAVCIHITNTPLNIVQVSSFSSDFASTIENAWNKKNGWQHQDTSVLYLSIIAQGPRLSSFNLKILLKSLFFNTIKLHYKQHLEKQCNELNDIVSNIMSDLSRYTPKKLMIKKTEQNYISEPLSFFYTMLHLQEKAIEPNYYNASEQLADIEIDYLYSSLHIKPFIESKINHDMWAGVYSIKAPLTLDINECAKLLEFGGKYIISEINLFAPHNQALKSAKYHKKIANISNSDAICQVNGINQMFESDLSSNTAFCERQILITVYEKEREKFNMTNNRFVKIAQEIGIIAVREDFYSPKCFFSQLPGNFHYITRKQYLATQYIGLFSALSGKNTGSYHGSKWGQVVSILCTEKDKPYYFNFHDGDNGNTILMGSNKSSYTQLMHFLLAQATKLNPKIINITFDPAQNIFFEKLGATTITMKPENITTPFSIDIFNLQHFGNDEELFYKFFIDLILQKHTHLKEQYYEAILGIAKTIISINTTDQKISILREFTKTLNNQILEDSILYFIEKFYPTICKTDNFEIIKHHHIINLDFSGYSKDPSLLHYICQFLSVFLVNIPKLLDSQPTILSFADLEMLCESKVLECMMQDFLNALTAKNSIAFFGSLYQDKLYKTCFVIDTMNLFMTRIFMPNRFADNVLRNALSLTNDELYIIKNNSNKHLALLKHRDDSVTIKTDFQDLGSLI